MNRINNRFADKIPLSIFFLLGGIYIFAALNISHKIMFQYYFEYWWVYLFPIIVLAPGWLVPLCNCRDIKSLLLWMLGVIAISFICNLLAYYGAGSGDLGPGAV